MWHLTSVREEKFPPHTRGWTPDGLDHGHRDVVSPAHAGMDLWTNDGLVRLGGFPRTRGDGPSSSKKRWPEMKFPPHTRGWTGRRRR